MGREAQLNVVAETTALQVISSYGCHFMDSSWHTATKDEENTHASTYSKKFKKLDEVNKALCEVELASAQTEKKYLSSFSFLNTDNAE